MKVPKTFVKDKELGRKLEELLKEDKVNIIVVEEKEYASLYCHSLEGEVLLQFNEEGIPEKILGCEKYDEHTGYCTGKGGSCKYLDWKTLKPYKS